MRHFLLFILFSACAPTASFDLPEVSRGRLASFELYVATDGNDLNECTQVAPCATLQRAHDVLPDVIDDGYTVHIAAGTYVGVVMTKTIRPSRDGSASFLNFEGTLLTLASGTVTSFTPAGAGALAVVSDTAQSWTPDEHKGRLFEAGGTWYVIQSNTSNAILVAMFSATRVLPGASYAIVDRATVLTDLPADTGGPLGYTAWPSGAIKIDSAASSPGPNPIVFQKLVAGQIWARGPNRLMLAWVKFDTLNNLNDGTTCHHCYGHSISSGSYAGSGESLHISRSVFEGGTISAATANLIQSSYFSGGNPACFILGNQGTAAQAQIVSTMFDACARGIYVSNSSGAGGVGQVGVSTSTIRNSTVAGVYFASPLASADLKSITGSGNAVGVWLSEGGHANCPAACTITGTADFKIDYVDYTQAQLRANTPRVLPYAPSPYGSVLYE